MADIMPGNIIVVAGAMNAGKTGFLLNTIRENMKNWNVYYFSSEMGDRELKKRLLLFDSPLILKDWNFVAKERSDGFGDIVVSGEGNLNIIDYIEIYEDFYKVGGYLSQIWRRLNGAIAIVALQMNPGQLIARGGYGSLEKPRLYLALNHGKLTVVKAKNWRTRENPNNQEIRFKLVDGCKFIAQGNWYRREDEKEKK